jgi:hypothetical protein
MSRSMIELKGSHTAVQKYSTGEPFRPDAELRTHEGRSERAVGPPQKRSDLT